MEIDSSIAKFNAKTVMFQSGCEFLVTKREKIEDEHHIYLREIQTGLVKHPYLWLDDKLFLPKHKDIHRLLN